MFQLGLCQLFDNERRHVGLRFPCIALPFIMAVYHVYYTTYTVYATTDIVIACFLTMCVGMDRVHGYSPLV